MNEDRAERPTGFLPWIGAALSRWRATEPEAPVVWPVQPRGFDELSELLQQVRSTPAKSLTPIKRDAEGRSILTARQWCDLAGVRPCVGVVAVLLASEADDITKYPQYAWSIAEAVVNAASEFQRGETLEDAIVRRVVGDSRPPYNAHFAAQGGRWASTRQQPNARHLACAELAVMRMLTGHANLLARDATQWTDNDTQHLIHAKAVKSGDFDKALRNPTPEVVMNRRYRSGRRWVGPIVDSTGAVLIDPWKLSLLTPHGGVDYETAKAMLADGRRRWRRPA